MCSSEVSAHSTPQHSAGWCILALFLCWHKCYQGQVCQHAMPSQAQNKSDKMLARGLAAAWREHFVIPDCRALGLLLLCHCSNICLACVGFVVVFEFVQCVSTYRLPWLQDSYHNSISLLLCFAWWLRAWCSDDVNSSECSAEYNEMCEMYRLLEFWMLGNELLNAVSVVCNNKRTA